MKIRITKREKNMIVILVGILLICASYYLGYHTFKDKTEVLKQQNQILESQIQTLESISESQEEYVAKTQEMQTRMNDIIQKFPADLISEDIILYIRNMEQKTDSYVHNITIPAKMYVNITAPLEEDVLSSFEDVTGAISEYGFVNDGKVPDTRSMQLAQVDSDVNCSVTYEGLKDIIEDITESENRKSVDNISLAFNENTGDLAGSMTVSYYTLSGTGREYLQPTVAGTSHGIDCIFGGLKTTAEDTAE